MLGVGLWFAGELGGMAAGVAITGRMRPLIYLSALVPAVIGAVIAALIVLNLEDRSAQAPAEF